MFAPSFLEKTLVRVRFYIGLAPAWVHSLPYFGTQEQELQKVFQRVHHLRLDVNKSVIIQKLHTFPCGGLSYSQPT